MNGLEKAIGPMFWTSSAFLIASHFILGGVATDSQVIDGSYLLAYRDADEAWTDVSRAAYWVYNAQIAIGSTLALSIMLYAVMRFLRGQGARSETGD